MFEVEDKKVSVEADVFCVKQNKLTVKELR